MAERPADGGEREIELTAEQMLQQAALCNSQRRHQEAERLLRAFLQAVPAHHEALRELAIAVGGQRRPDEAVRLAELAVAYAPRDALSLTVLATVLAQNGEWEESGVRLAQALAIAPSLPAAVWNQALRKLAYRCWRDGWRGYRYGQVLRLRPLRFPSDDEWSGDTDQYPSAATLLIWAEQGCGDTIMLLRCLRGAILRWREYHARRIVLEVQEPLVPLLLPLRRQLGVHAIYAQTPGGAAPCAYDAHCSLHELPRVLDLCSEKEYRCGPYIPGFAPSPAPPFRVGTAWRGNPDHANDHERSLPDAAMARLWQVPGVEWVVLAPGQTTGLPDRCIVPDLPDYEATRQAIGQCHLIVSCDTSVAHLAGAMGVPVLLMLPYIGDWRWGRPPVRGTAVVGEQTLWYESVRAYRQTEPGEWAPVVDAVRNELCRRRDQAHAER